MNMLCLVVWSRRMKTMNMTGWWCFSRAHDYTSLSCSWHVWGDPVNPSLFTGSLPDGSLLNIKFSPAVPRLTQVVRRGGWLLPPRQVEISWLGYVGSKFSTSLQKVQWLENYMKLKCEEWSSRDADLMRPPVFILQTCNPLLFVLKTNSTTQSKTQVVFLHHEFNSWCSDVDPFAWR